MNTNHRIPWAHITWAVVAGLIVIVLYLTATDLQGQVHDLGTGNTPAAVRSRQDRANSFFITCAKSTSAADPKKRADFAKACAGYDTLEHAYRTQHVPPPEDP